MDLREAIKVYSQCPYTQLSGEEQMYATICRLIEVLDLARVELLEGAR